MEDLPCLVFFRADSSPLRSPPLLACGANVRITGHPLETANIAPAFVAQTRSRTQRLTTSFQGTHTVSMETIARQSESGLERHLGYWLRQVSNHVSGEFRRALQARRTSVAEWVVLCLVQERPGITPGELAEALALTRGAVSKVIDKLEAKNWITGSTKPGDNRARLFSLTPRGSRVLPELRRIADRNDQTFFAVLQDGERATLQRLLAKLIEHHEIGTVPIQ